jgi:hypothetical protein
MDAFRSQAYWLPAIVVATLLFVAALLLFS